MNQNIDIIIELIKCLSAVLAGILLGNGAVFMFNHMPADWFCDYDETPSDKKSEKRDIFGSSPSEIRDPYTQRVKSTPWKYYFSMLFVAAGLYLIRIDVIYAIVSLAAMWILLELSIADIKYRIVPDQLLILLAVTSIGMIPFREGWKDMLAGAACGFIVMGAAALLGKAFYRRDSIGGGDIKLFSALGLLLGLKGVIAVFMLSALLSGAHLTILLATHKIKLKDTIPMVPYIAASAGIYIMFLDSQMDAIISSLL